MKHVRLPSGIVLNLASVILVTKDSDGAVAVAIGAGPDDVVTFTGADGAMLLAWAAKRPLLVPPARGGKSV